MSMLPPAARHRGAASSPEVLKLIIARPVHRTGRHYKLTNRIGLGIALAALSLGIAVITPVRVPSTGKGHRETKSNQNLVREVRHQLLLLPYYSVFDNLLFKVDGDHVTLEGQVTRPTLKSDAEAAVKS